MLKLAWKYMRYYRSQTLAIFASIFLTASLLAGISSLICSSQKNDLLNSKTIYGDWHYYVETSQEQLQRIQGGVQEEGYHLRQCGKKEIRDVIEEEFLIYFIRTDETYRRMAHRDLSEGAYPEAENEIAADRFVLNSLGFTGNLGDSIHIGARDYVVTGVVKSKWAAGADEMEIFVGDSFTGRGSQTFLYLGFDEDEKLYKQLDAFLKTYQISSDTVVGNEEVIRYLAGEAPESIYDIVKFGLTNEEGNLTYIVLKLQSSYNLVYNGMMVLLCLFSIFVVYSVFNISVAKRISEYGILQTLGVSSRQIGMTLLLELWMLFFLGYPLGCLAGNGILSLACQRSLRFYLSWDAMIVGFIFLLVSLAASAFLMVRSLRKRSLREVMNGESSFIKKRKIYALHHVNMADVVVQKFMFANKKKVIGILLSLSIGGCLFLCTTYMVENLKIHARLSLKSDDGLGSEYRISLKSNSLRDTIPKEAADKIRNMPETADVYASKYTLGELVDIKELEWEHYFDEMNQDPSFIRRFGGICIRQEDGTYRIKYDVYGYDDGMLKELDEFILEGEIRPGEIKQGNQIVVVANMDGQGNYYFYGKKPGDTVTLRVPQMDGFTDELLKFQSGEENYIEKEFEIAAIVSRSLAKEEDFLNVGFWKDCPSVIMTNEQMEENFGITDYRFINASPVQDAWSKKAGDQILQAIQDIPKAVLQDYAAALETQKNYLKRQQIFFSGIAVTLLVISLFHIVNSMNHTILARRREYGIIRAMGMTDSGFYRMIIKTGILYGLLADVFLFLIYHLVLRRGMDYYMAHVLQFLHVASDVPDMVLYGIMLLNVVIAVSAVMFPAWKMIREDIISEITQ